MSFLFQRERGTWQDSVEERRADRAQKKARRLIRASYEPVIPAFCRIIFFCMVLFPVLDLILEVHAQVRSAGRLEAGAFFVRVTWSMLLIWGFFAAFLLVLANIQLVRAVRFGYVEKVYRFPADLRPNERLEDFEVERRPEEEKDAAQMTLYSREVYPDTRRKYLRYILVAGIGFCVFYVLYRIAGGML